MPGERSPYELRAEIGTLRSSERLYRDALASAIRKLGGFALNSPRLASDQRLLLDTIDQAADSNGELKARVDALGTAIRSAFPGRTEEEGKVLEMYRQYQIYALQSRAQALGALKMLESIIKDVHEIRVVDLSLAQQSLDIRKRVVLETLNRALDASYQSTGEKPRSR